MSNMFPHPFHPFWEKDNDGFIKILSDEDYWERYKLENKDAISEFLPFVEDIFNTQHLRPNEKGEFLNVDS